MKTFLYILVHSREPDLYVIHHSVQDKLQCTFKIRWPVGVIQYLLSECNQGFRSIIFHHETDSAAGTSKTMIAFGK